MNGHSLGILEYGKIKEVVREYAVSDPGKEKISELMPAVDYSIVSGRLDETKEFMHLLNRGEHPPLDGIKDIRPQLEKIPILGSSLLSQELLNVASTLNAGRRVKNFFQKFGGEPTPVPLLLKRVAAIQPLKHIEDAVFAAINEQAEVKDSASPALRKLRRQIGRVREEILERMRRILQSSAGQKVIQDPVITLREDRYVLPLKPNFRQALKGIVHGQSGSRATLFVEPIDVLDQNNRLTELRIEEREEVDRILRELTALMSQDAAAIEALSASLAEIDALCARARFGAEFRAVVPEISSNGRIQLRGARHPLLVRKNKTRGAVTPNDIDIGERARLLIISGPNAGGKTVLLKTVGLLCLMAQSGLPVTAAEGSSVPVFNAVYADIGDEQSLEQDVSTFSSHMIQIADILRNASADSLVLLDELGSGTAPAEGGALGAAVLEGLIGRGCLTVVTTHHNALKQFGSSEGGAQNAAMEFNPETLKPTYRFIAGRPGRSYGLEIASRLGLPEETIARARTRLSEADVKLESVLEQIEENSRSIAARKEDAAQALAAAEQERAGARQALAAAREEARALTMKAKDEAREVLSALRQRLRELSRVSMLDRAQTRETQRDIESLGKRLEPAPRTGVPDVSSAVRVGDRVRVPKLNKTGTVVLLSKEMLELEIDGKKLKISPGEVLPVAEPAQQKTTFVRGWGAALQEIEGVPDTLNIIGLHVPEALEEVERFLDRAMLGGFSSITIIHGIGTGALKKAVTELLQSHPLIAALRPGKPEQGGPGVTIAELKK